MNAYFRHNKHSFHLCNCLPHAPHIDIEEFAMSLSTFEAHWTGHVPAGRESLIRRLYRAARHELQMRRAIREVNSLDERTLIDIGMVAGSTEHAVRRGRAR